MERSKRSLTVRMKHEDDYGVNEDSNLSHSVRASIKEDSQRTTTLTDNKKERLRKQRIFNAWRLMHWHQQRFTCSPSVSGHFTHCWVSLWTSCRQFNCCRCNHSLNFWPVREFLVEIHTAKTGLLRCCLHTAQEKGLQSWQTVSRHYCLRFSVGRLNRKKVVSVQGGQTINQRLSTPRPASKIVLKNLESKAPAATAAAGHTEEHRETGSGAEPRHPKERETLNCMSWEKFPRPFHAKRA